MATVTRENIGLLNEKIIVKVAKEDYLASFEKSLKNYSKKANIPGFRKGMVPAGMIKKMHGQAVFTDEVLRTVEKELSNYMVNEKLEVFAQPLPLPETDARQIDMNNPAEYAFAFEVGLKPEFQVADPSKLNSTKYKVAVTNEMVGEEIERLQLRHGKMTEPETITGDDNLLNVVFTETDKEGNKIENGISKDNSLLVKYFVQTFRPDLIGKKKDDVVILQLSQAFSEKEMEWILSDLGLEEKDIAGSEKFFEMRITKVGFVERSLMNEDFYKTVYPDKEIKTEEEFREMINEEMKNYWEKQSRNHFEHEMYHLLVDHTKIDFPESFLKRWMQNGTDKPKSQEEVEKEFPEFVNQLKWTLITDKILREQHIEITADDIKAFAKQQLFGYMPMKSNEESQPWLQDYVNRMMEDKKFVEDAYHRLRTRKVFEWAESNVRAVEKSISSEEFGKLLHEHQHHKH